MNKVHISKLTSRLQQIIKDNTKLDDYIYVQQLSKTVDVKAVIRQLCLHKKSSSLYASESALPLITYNNVYLYTRGIVIAERLSMVELTEMRRQEMVSTSRKDTKARYERRKAISPSSVTYKAFEIKQFLSTGKLVFHIDVKDYKVTIEVNNILVHLKQLINDGKRINYKNIYSYLGKSLDKSDLLIDCTCPDFRYRFAYVATKNKFKANSPETRPAKVTNPSNMGVCCKHLLHILSNKLWIRKYVSLINMLIKLNPNLLN